MASSTGMPDHASVLGEVREVRRAGIMRLRQLDVPALTRLAAMAEPGAERRSVERLLRHAVSRIDASSLRDAAEFSLGLAQGTRDWPPADRRKRAAGVYGVSVERFRKHHEVMVLAEIADEALRLAAETAAAAPRAAARETAGPPPVLAPAHRTLRVPLGPAGRTVPVSVHVHPVDLLRDVDVVVSSANTYLALPEAFKSSVPASLRRAAALRDPAGELVRDLLHEELQQWVARHGTPGRPVLGGTVAATSPGALRRQGIRRVYHAAVAHPRPGSNDYDVLPADITRCTARAFALLGEEHGGYQPPLSSICFPLLGSGRGGLPPEESVAALWAGVEAELARGAPWRVHFVVRRPERAELLERLLT